MQELTCNWKVPANEEVASKFPAWTCPSCERRGFKNILRNGLGCAGCCQSHHHHVGEFCSHCGNDER